ncbi:MAG TPA: FAD:protein FMN transferase [Candidatus Limnocylindrales bacterium]
MGTTVSIDVRRPLVDRAAIDDAMAWFHDVDRRFSLFRPESEASRVAVGALRLDDASPDVRAMVTLAETVRERTGGYFDARRHRPDGRLDPTGIVKGWSVDEAISLLRLAGASNVQVVAGGDVFAAGEASHGSPWRVGIRHPEARDRVAVVLSVSNLAVATSGLYERGGHIRDPHTGRVADGLTSFTVVGPTLTLADAYATAAFAMGERGLDWIAGQPGFGGLAITRDARVVWTPLVDELLVPAQLAG